MHQITLFSGDSLKLPACATVADLQAAVSCLYPDFLPPEILVFDDSCDATLEETEAAPDRVSVLFLAKDRTDTSLWETSLFTYAGCGDVLNGSRCAKELVHLGAGTNALLRGAARGDDIFVSLLLSSGVDANVPCEDGWSANTTITTFLKEFEVYRDGWHCDATALMCAARMGRGEVLNTLLCAQADVNAGGCGAVLEHGVASKNAEIVQALLTAGARIKGTDALLESIKVGSAEIMHLLLAEGAAVNQGNVNGCSLLNFRPLTMAALRGDVDSVEVLLDLGAEVNSCMDCGGTALSEVIVHNNEPNPQTNMIVKILLAAAADPNCVAHNDRRTCLDIAISQGNTELMAILEEAGAKTYLDAGIVDASPTVVHVCGY